MSNDDLHPIFQSIVGSIVRPPVQPASPVSTAVAELYDALESTDMIYVRQAILRAIAELSKVTAAAAYNREGPRD
jgi:hypothetical protein